MYQAAELLWHWTKEIIYYLSVLFILIFACIAWATRDLKRRRF